jgi:hypothetical protein
VNGSVFIVSLSTKFGQAIPQLLVNFEVVITTFVRKPSSVQYLKNNLIPKNLTFEVMFQPGSLYIF